MSALVEIRNLSKVYERGKQKIEVLHHVELDIDKGDFVALMGPSGSGKTTLLNLIGGLDSPTDGSITVGRPADRSRWARALCAKWRAANVGFVFQFYNLLPMLSARRNVELPLLLTGSDRLSASATPISPCELVGLADRACAQAGRALGRTAAARRHRTRDRFGSRHCSCAMSRRETSIASRRAKYSPCCSSSIVITAKR